ncbi:sodium-dependent transporter [Millionella massiliensis]|uniref:sodium-dependent transporter n=1 Tax=Millionella massiliensis TaxID=1871023 RepID=UPI0008D9DFD9|nr:sodium-dependent transporter [Millionella massiliensis]
MKEQRGAFSSNFGTMMAVVGSAVGLGNIWRFPYLAGVNGGAAFLLLYLFLILLVGLPLILSEFVIGRATHRGAVGSFKQLAPRSKWYLVGYMGVVAGFCILGFYSVIAGWSVRFLYDSIINANVGLSHDEIAASFNAFKNTGWQPILLSAGFLALTAFVVLKGVEKGVERWNKILMPLLIFILLLLCINSFTLDGFGAGMSFLFKPDFSKITANTVLDALGQVFFTLSLGMGVMITYSSYVVKPENMLRSKGIVTMIDTSIAIISGIAIFPAVFTFGISPTQGPDLIFLTLPNVFGQMAGGQYVGILFFLLITIAALTSMVSIFEMMTNYMMEELKMTRRRAVLWLLITLCLVAALCAQSQVEGSRLMIGDYNVFDFLDMLSSNYLMTIGGLLIVIFAGWHISEKRLRKVFTTNGMYNNRIFPVFRFVIRYVSPIAVAIIFLSKIGLIKG